MKQWNKNRVKHIAGQLSVDNLSMLELYWKCYYCELKSNVLKINI